MKENDEKRNFKMSFRDFLFIKTMNSNANRFIFNTLHASQCVEPKANENVIMFMCIYHILSYFFLKRVINVTRRASEG